jgi:hypothetical protein
LLLRLRLAAGRTFPAPAAATTAPSAARGLLAGLVRDLIGRLIRGLLPGRPLLLGGSLLLPAVGTRRTLRAIAALTSLLLLLLFLRSATALLIAVALRLSRASASAAAFLTRTAGWFAGALFELAHLLLHIAARLLILFRAQLVVSAVRAAFPTFRIRLFARGAKDTFGQRHLNRRALYTSPLPVNAGEDRVRMDEDRRRTLQTLLELAGESSPTACWDDARAIALLRSQATREELREAGASESLIAHIFAEEHAG